MSAKKRRLDRLNVVSPCSTDWDRMSGDEKKRFCSECNKFVYDFSQMTRRQVEAIVSINQGKMCARITRRPDGSLLTLESPPVLTVVTRRAAPVVNAALAAILGISLPANALNVEASAARPIVRSDADRDGDRTPYGGAEALVGGTVLDPQGAAIPNAVVKLVSSAGAELKTNTSSEGEFTFAQVPYGNYIMLIEAQGFYTHVNSNVIVDTPHDMRFEVTMKAKKIRLLTGMIATGGGHPQSLLDLYRQSDMVAIATIGRSAIVETEEDTKRIRTALRISSQFKGENNPKVIPFYHWVDDLDPDTFKPGDRLLVFLQHRQSEEGARLDGYEASDYENSVKKLDDGALAIYRQRIEELRAIYQRGNPDPGEVAEWLMRLVEEPVTRREGAIKLSESLYLLESQRDQDNEAESQSVESDKAMGEDESDDKEEDSDEESSDDDVAQWEKEDAELAAALTKDHKARLANILFGVTELKEDDMALVRAVEELGDERLAPYLLSQLRRIADEAPELATSLIQTIARLIKDEDLNRLIDDQQTATRAAIFDRIDSVNMPDQQDSTQDQRANILTTVAAKRREILKDFLKLVEYKTKSEIER